MKSKLLLVVAAFLFTISLNAQSTVDSIAAKYKLLPMPEPLTIEKAFPVIGSYQLVTNENQVNNANQVTSNVTTSTNQTTLSTDTTTVNNANTVNDANLSETLTPNVTVYLDSASKGIVWVEGLPEGKFKAFLKKSPSTYRIISQKTESGVQIPEGTLFFDTEANVLNIALGKEFNEEDPTAIFATSVNAETAPVAKNTAKTAKSKKAPAKAKLKLYTATKVVPADKVEPTEKQSSTFDESLNKSIEQQQ